MDRNPRLSVCEFPFNANWMFSIFRKWVKLHHHLPHTTSRGTARFLIRTSSCSPVVIMSFASPVSKNTQPELSSKMFQNSTGSANSQPNGRSSFIMFYPENLSGYLPYTQPSGGQPCLSHLQARWHRWSRPAAGSTQRRACACSCLKLPIDTPWIGSCLGERNPKAQVRLMNSRDKDGSGIHPSSPMCIYMNQIESVSNWNGTGPSKKSFNFLRLLYSLKTCSTTWTLQKQQKALQWKRICKKERKIQVQNREKNSNAKCNRKVSENKKTS